MEIERYFDHEHARIILTGRFDFHAHRDFRQCSDEVLADQAVKELDINFGRVDYLDSSALGMLLLLREKAEARGKRIVLSGLQGTVKQVLDIANFGKLFTLRD
ncbi:MAG: STAS domain-containing protein [Thiobacillaceae bacterium]